MARIETPNQVSTILQYNFQQEWRSSAQRNITSYVKVKSFLRSFNVSVEARYDKANLKVNLDSI